MVRILGNNLSNKKKMYIALTAIYGIGINTSKKILERLKDIDSRGSFGDNIAMSIISFLSVLLDEK